MFYCLNTAVETSRADNYFANTTKSNKFSPVVAKKITKLVAISACYASSTDLLPKLVAASLLLKLVMFCTDYQQYGYVCLNKVVDTVSQQNYI